MTTITITELGNGFPENGELIGSWGDDGATIYRVVSGGRIETHGSGRGNTCCCECEEVSVGDAGDEVDLSRDDLGLRPVALQIDE